MTEYEIEAAEDAYRTRLIEVITERELNRKDFRPQASAQSIGSRRAVILKLGEGAFNRPGAKRRAESRSHSRAKEPLKELRRSYRY